MNVCDFRLPISDCQKLVQFWRVGKRNGGLTDAEQKD
jgi:hypothetical protein